MGLHYRRGQRLELLVRPGVPMPVRGNIPYLGLE